MTTQTRSRVLIIGARLLLLVMFCAASGCAIQYGLAWRRWAWDATDLIHFYSDMNNGLHWGSQANLPEGKARGFLNVYDQVAGSADTGNDSSLEYGLDYAPLRLLLITRWEKWAMATYPKKAQEAINIVMMGWRTEWHPSYAFYAPLLRFNDATEMFGALGLFLLTRHWVLRGDRRWGSTCPVGTWGAIRRPFRGCVAGLIAALLFWFNPAVILSAHGWPTWDEWIIPFFVWTVWLCCVDWWFTAGLVLAVGAMFKGQQFFVAPMFILWPLLAGRPIAALRWVSGVAIGVALLASPWLLSYVPGGVTDGTTPADRVIDFKAVSFVLTILLLIALPLAVYWWVRRFRNVEPAAEPVELPELSRWQRWAQAVGPRALALAKLVYGPVAALAVAASLFLCARWFHGSLNWLYIGWGYGTRHYLQMTMGLSDNLAGILNFRYGWDDLGDVVFSFGPYHLQLWPTHVSFFDAPTDVTIRIFLVSLYVVAFVLCVVGMTIHYRRNDPRFLVAVTAVWVMFFTLMPQIHERYLLYAAGVGCSLTAVGGGFVMLDLFMTALTFIMTLHVMLVRSAQAGQLGAFGKPVSPTFGHSLLRAIDGTHPDAGWAVMLCAGIFLFGAFAPSRRVKSRFDDSGPVVGAEEGGEVVAAVEATGSDNGMGSVVGAPS